MRFFASPCSVGVLVIALAASGRAADRRFMMSEAEYVDRVEAAWQGQIVGVLLTFPFEHKVSAVRPPTQFPKPHTSAQVDDDWYYEIVALRGFEQHGPGMTVEQLGALWQLHNCGTWGSSRAALEAMRRGVNPADAGHPRHNRLWFTIGPMFSCELYGLIAPGNPNLAGELARSLGRINGHAEGLDAGVFSAAVVSLAFRESDSREIVRQAARLIAAESPMRQALDMMIQLAERGQSPREVFDAIEDRWHIEYPATNNAVANAALMAACIWFGQGEFDRTIELASSAGDFVDADNIAAVACAVVGAMRGTAAMPRELVDQLNDRIVGSQMGGLVQLTPPVDERISDLAVRTAAVGEAMLVSRGATFADATISAPVDPIETQPLQRYTLGDLTASWNAAWSLERAGFGGGDGGLGGIRGLTHLEGEVLATYPRDEIRGLVLRRAVHVSEPSLLTFQAGVDPGRAWSLEVYLNNTRTLKQLLAAPESASDRSWQLVSVDLSALTGEDIEIRLLQRVLIDGKTAGNAYWKDLKITAH